MKAFRYRLPLKSSLRLVSENVDHRDGILLHSEGSWSDVAPLPGFSKESIEDVVRYLKQPRRHCPPALKFGLDALERPLEPCSVPVNALLQRGTPEVMARCRVLADSACEVVKLKVGRGDLRAEIELVREVRDVLRADQRLRLDANRAWDFKAAREFATRVADCSIEYIEEPLQNALELEELFAATGMRYALDETLADRTSLDLFPNVAALVYKPTLLGGRQRIHEIVGMGKPIVFSACFESGVGIARIAQLASEFSPHVAAGLDTHSWLSADVVSAGLERSDWRLEIKPYFEVDLEQLEEVEL
jgi:O-succinylbenzoate synthase